MNNIDKKIKEILKSPDDFEKCIKNLDLKSEHLLKAVFLVTAKLAKCRENRQSDGPINSKGLTFLTQTAHFHIKNQTILESIKEQRLLLKSTTENDAQLYFIDKMTNKTITDKYGREIKIQDSSLECYYKDNESFRHTIAPENYKIYRARRLPWVIPSIVASQEIYQLDKPRYKCTDFFYITKFLIPYEDINTNDIAEERYHENYFIVVARRKYNMKTLDFVTEYPIFDYFDLLKYIERWSPYDGQ